MPDSMQSLAIRVLREAITHLQTGDWRAKGCHTHLGTIDGVYTGNVTITLVMYNERADERQPMAEQLEFPAYVDAQGREHAEF